jgi:hypothetical protein
MTDMQTRNREPATRTSGEDKSPEMAVLPYIRTPDKSRRGKKIGATARNRNGHDGGSGRDGVGLPAKTQPACG